MANNDVRTYTITLGKVYNNGVECKDPIVTVAGGQDIAINCINKDACLYKVQVGPGVTEPCITILVQCEDCGSCPPEEKTYCFCDSIEDCDACEYCGTNGFCVQLCDPEDCINGTCVGCQDDEDCTCNKICQNGECGCPAGTVENPTTGCCDECQTDGDCEDCDLCKTVNGAKTCVPRECVVGVVKLSTCECVECNNSSDCDGEHECCNSNNECNCCPGFIRINGVCTYVPCQFDDDCEVCEYCDPLTGCQPIDCATGVCNPATDSCEEPCDGDCPVGQGCLNGFCVPCDQLSCSGVISQCSQAAGCSCNGDVCEYVNCQTSDCVDWISTPPVVVPGTPVPGSGVPAPSFTVQFTQLGIVSMSGGSGNFLNYSITITESGGNVGTWAVEGTTLGSGSTITFELDDPTNVQWNNVGFEVTFVGNAGQTGSIVIYNTNWFAPGNGYTEDLFTTPANWVYDVQGTSVAPTSNGGSFTPGSLKLCPCGEDATIIGYSWTTIEGNLTVTFTPLADGCVRATVQGCGIGEGTATIDCAGIQTTLPLPPLPFDYSGANCCDPLTDPDCNSTPGDGFGCTTLDPLVGEIVLSNTNFVTGDGYGLFRGVFQPDSIGYTIPQWIRVARTVCWSVTGTVREASSFIPPVLQHLFHDIEYRNGVGCLQMGYTCDIKVANCKKVQAEVCFQGCEAFSVSIVDNNPTFSANVSLGNNVQVDYAWSTNTGDTGSAPMITLPSPNTTVTSITLVVTLNVNGTICTASDSIAITLDAIEGCTNPNACNYNEDATVDDGSCIIVAAPSYDCRFGFVPGMTSVLSELNPVISYVATGGALNGAVVAVNQPLAAGTYTIGTRFDGQVKCEHQLVVPVCYTCSGDDCVAASNLNNVGFAANDCDESCGCSVEIAPYFQRSGSLAKIYVNATGGTGLHVVSIVKSGGGSVLFSNGTFSGGNPAVTVDLCDGNYVITVADNNCTKTANIGVTGYDCGNSSMEFLPDTRCQALGLGDGPCFDCTTNQVFYTFAGDACATQYTRRLQNSAETISYGSVQVSGVTGQGTIPTGIYPGDGLYKVTITSNNSPACEIEQVIGLNCIAPSECDIDLSIPASATHAEVGGDLQITASFHLETGGDLYNLQLIQMVGGIPSSCTGGSNGAILQTVSNQMGVPGLNQTVFPLIDMPPVTTCYKIVITKVGDATCTTQAFESVNPFILPAAPCGGNITSPNGVSAIYNEETEMLYVSWAFSSTSGNMTVKVYVSSGGVCDIDVDPLVVDSDGHGQSGDGWFGPIPQIQGQAQCITVVVHDTNDETCSDTVESEIPECECEVEILETEVDPETETLNVTFRTKCTSGDVDFFVTGDATESQSINDASTDGQWLEDFIEITLSPYPSVGGAIDLEMTDNVDGGCTETITNIEIPSNCEGCGQVATFFLNDSVVTQIRDEANNLIVNGTYDLTSPTDVSDLEADIESGVVAQDGNFCLTGDEVDVSATRLAGAIVNQDSTDFVVLDHALITNGEWVGTKKVYFGDCGCETGRTCDYTAQLAIGASDAEVFFYYGTANLGGDYTGTLQWTGMTQTPSGSLLTQIQNDILNALENLSGCGFTVASVSVTYDTGTDILTIVINDTNAAVGLVAAGLSGGGGFTTVADFTQSGCA